MLKFLRARLFWPFKHKGLNELSIVFIHSSQKERLKRIKSRKNFNNSVFQKLKRLQLPLDFKKKRSDYVIKNNFKKDSARKNVKYILTKIL